MIGSNKVEGYESLGFWIKRMIGVIRAIRGNTSTDILLLGGLSEGSRYDLTIANTRIELGTTLRLSKERSQKGLLEIPIPSAG